MNFRPSTGKLMLGLIGLILAALVVLAVLAQPHGRSFTLSDGTVLTLEHVSFGKQHRFDGRRWWERWLSRSPASWQRRLRTATTPPVAMTRVMTHSTTNDTLVLWFRVRRASASASPVWSGLRVMDENAQACGQSIMRYSQVLSGIRQIEGIGFDAFPRRGRKIILRYYQQNPATDQEELKWEFPIANPARGPFAAWQPEPLPATQRDGPVEFTLTRLVAGVDIHNWARRATNPIKAGTLAAFRVSENGHAVTNWQVMNILSFDATGNVAGNQMHLGHQDKGEWVMALTGGLWPDEPVWKLRTEFSRDSDFLPEELWTVRGLRTKDILLGPHWIIPTNILSSTNLAGYTLELKQLHASGSGEANRVDPVWVNVRVDPAPAGHRLAVVKVTNEKGESIGRDLIGWGGWGIGGGKYQFYLRDLGDAQTLDLTFAFHKSRFAEFTVKPERK